MKQQRVLILLVLAFGVVVLVGALQNANLSQPAITDNTEAEEDVLTFVFSGWGPDNVFAVNIFDPVAQFGLTITRQGDDLWELVDFRNLLTQEEGDLAAASMALFPQVRVLEPIDNTRYDEFGLTQQDLTMLLSVILKSGEEHVIAIGDLTSSEDAFYALVDDLPNLYIVDARPVGFFTSLLRRAYEADNN